MIEFIAVYDGPGILLYDIYVDKDWIGSRRTLYQCHLQVNL